MNPINSLGSAGLAAVGGSSLPVGGGNGNVGMMMHPNASFDPNMASSVTLACCQSLCDVLTELPLPSAVIDKSTHTRTLITGGLNGTNRSTLSDLSLVPNIQQALFLAKQQLSEITFLNNPSPSPLYQPPNIVSPPNSESSAQPSPLILALSSQNCFFNSQNASLFQQHSGGGISSSAAASVVNNAVVQSANNLSDLNTDLQTIEPSIDRHLTDLPQNLMNDLINDDCDMSSTSNDLSHFQQHPHQPLQPPLPHQNQSQQHQPQQLPHHQQHLHQQQLQQQQQQQPHHHHHQQQQLSQQVSAAIPHVSNNEYSQQNHYRNTSHDNNFEVKEEIDLNYSSLGERVKSRQREAAQKANQATSAALSGTAPSTSNANSISNSNSQIVPEIPSPPEQQKPVLVRSESTSSSNNDKDWQLPTSNNNKRIKSENSNQRKSTGNSTASTATYTRRTYSEPKKQIRSVKYDFDYSDSMLLNSSVDIVVRFEQIIDEILSTSCNDYNDDEEDSDNDDFYVGDSKRSSKKKKNHAKSFDSNHVNGMSFDVSIEADQLKEIMILSAKLKQTNRVAEIERKKILLFLTVLSNQLNIWFARYKSKANTAHNNEEEDYEDIDEREHFWELCCNASQSALHVMTSTTPNTETSLFSHEELIEVIVDFLSNNLSSATHVTSSTSSNSRSPKTKIHTVHFGVSKRHVTRWTQQLQLLFEFINLRTKGSLTDTLILSLTRISMSALFLLQNTAEMQFVSIEILCHVFEEYQRHRMSILEELLNSLSKIPTKKSHRKDSVLTQMLIRLTNAFFQPNLASANSGGNKGGSANTLHTRDSLHKQHTAALQIITGFLSHFLRKCHQHSSSNDVDFKLIFESLLNDLLDSLHSPHSTASILLVHLITKLLMSYLSSNQTKSQTPTLTARNLSIEYLSIICSKMAQFLAEKDGTISELEKTLSTIEEAVKPPPSSKKKQNNNKSENGKSSQEKVMDKVWNLLVDYFNSEKLYREKLVLGSIWLKEKYLSENEERENKFLQKLNITKPMSDDVNNDSVVDISTAALCIQYMEFVHFSTNTRLFELAISYITASLSNTTNTTQRSKAMKCLSNILSSSSIERASQLLSRSDLQNAMRSALLDPSTSVREATVDLIGRFVLQSKDQTLCQRYCDLIGERILDTGISVRKRVIKILRDFCIEFPEFEKCGEIAARIVRRINDDGEGIRRLVVDTCRDLWFSSTNSSPIKFKVYSLLHVIATMLNDSSNMESMQSLFDQLVKPETMPIAQQICDCVMSDILIDDLPQSKKMTQLSAIQCVAMLSQCCPPLMVKHCDTLQSFLSLSCETLIEISVRMKVIQTIERVLPHINNPSPQLLTRIEEDLTKNILQSTANIIQCSVKCLAILIKNHTKNRKLAVDLFNKFQQILYQYKGLLYDGQLKEELVKPKLLRAIFTCGLFAKFFSADIWESKDRVRDTFIQLIQSPYSVDIKCKSIVALGFIIESDPKICLQPQVVDIYTRILKNEFSTDENVQLSRKNDEMFCIQVLNNFRNYLSESIESDENAVKTIEWSRESLKSMQSAEDDSCSAQSQIIQKYLSSILINALNPNLAIRRVACNVIHVIHSGGHVHPLQLVPHLVAMTSDDDPQIRMRADHVLHEIERKYHGFVAMKSKEAIYLSAIFCKRLQCNGYRIYMEKSSATPSEGANSVAATVCTKEVCSRLSTLYQVICTNRQSRRGFIASFLRHLDTSDMIGQHDFSDLAASTSAHYQERIEIEFVVENVLFFPYTVYDEILYILTQLECTSSINSTNITQLFKEIFIVDKPQPDPSQFPPSQQMNQLYPQSDIHYQNMNYPNAIIPNSNMPPPMHGFPNAFHQENVIEDLEDIDLDNEEHFKKYENNIHVNFELLISDSRNERLNNLMRSLRTMYLSTLLRTLLKEFYLLKDEKIDDYRAADAKTWEKPVHRRQIDSSHLKELFDFAKPRLHFPESLLLSENLPDIEKQLLDEWKRFRSVSLNNSDPNFKLNSITKLFQSKATATTTTAANQMEPKITKVNSENSECVDGGGQLDSESVDRSRRVNNVEMNHSVNAVPERANKKAKTPSKKPKHKKKRKRIVMDEDSSSPLSDDDDEDYDGNYCDGE